MSDTKKATMENEVDALKQNTEIAPETKKGFLVWIKDHKTKLILVGISIPTIIAIVLGLKNKEAIRTLWNQLNEEIKKANMYSSKWFETVTDEVLSTEREKVRLAYCSSGEDFLEADRLQKLLWRFDKEMSKRAWGDKIPHAPSIHREHGWYLPNDD